MIRAVLLVGIMLSVPLAARAEGDAASKRALILLRILAYDHHLVERAGDRVTVIVVYGAQSAASRAEQAELMEGLRAVQNLRVGGLPLHPVAYAVTDPEALRAKLARLRPAALYLCPGLGDLVESVSQTTRVGQVLSFAASEAYVRSGLSVGILAGPERTRVLINLAASRAEGVAFDAGLLKLAEVLR